MGMLYDFAVPFLHYDKAEFRIKWNGLCTTEKGDLSFVHRSTVGCVARWTPQRVVDERFDSVGGSRVKINYDEWIRFGRRRRQEDEEEEEEESDTWD
jgi:hypothetical protein